MDVTKMCRSCMKELKVKKVQTIDGNVLEKFLFCTGIQVFEDKLPTKFCTKCNNLIKSLYRFIKQAQKTNEKLKCLIMNEKSEPWTSEQYIVNNDVIYDESISKMPTAVDSVERCTLLNEMPIDLEEKIQANDYKNEQEVENIIDSYDEQHSLFDIHLKETENGNIQYVELHKKSEGQETTGHSSDILKTNNLKPEEENTVVANDNDSNTISCPICRKIYFKTNFKYLQEHIHKKHMQANDSQNITTGDMETNKRNGKLSCKECHKDFKSKIWLEKHIKREHSDDMFKCEHCNKACTSYNALLEHKKCHVKTKNHVCHVCNKRFRRRAHLAVHAITHSTERPFICDICNMTFKLKQVLIVHLKTHEPGKNNLCHVCGKRFAHQRNLKEHMVAHTNARPYGCGQCGYRGRQRASLRRHALRHLARAPHGCHHCQKAFNTTTQLSRHVRTHTGERPYQCPHCARSFIDNWKRKTHLMRDHRLPFELIPRLNIDGTPYTEQ